MSLGTLRACGPASCGAASLAYVPRYRRTRGTELSAWLRRFSRLAHGSRASRRSRDARRGIERADRHRAPDVAAHSGQSDRVYLAQASRAVALRSFCRAVSPAREAASDVTCGRWARAASRKIAV